MDTYNPIILNSKMATRDIHNIMSEHDKMIQGINTQESIVQAYKEQKRAEEENRQQMKMENDRDMLEAQNKQRELEIKAQALSI